MLALYLRHPDNQDPQAPRVPAQMAREAADYVRSLTQGNLPLRSTTRSGLTRKAQAWHQQIPAAQTQSSWTNHLQRRHNTYLAWDSALNSLTHQDLTAVALPDEKALFRESMLLNHCVYTYGPECAVNRSRIFSIRRNGESAATTEPKPQGGKWRPVQTRQYRNRQPTQDITDSAERTARAYTQATQATPHGRSWTVTDDGTNLADHPLTPAAPPDQPRPPGHHGD